VKHLYAPQYRPPGYATVPAGWELVENPKLTPFKRPDLPRSNHNFGVIAYERELTAEEIKSYELTYLGAR
jgi:hypothetical protein